MKTQMIRAILAVGSSALLAACSMGGGEYNVENLGEGTRIPGADGPGTGMPSDPTNPGDPNNPQDPNIPKSICEGMGKSYTGFGGTVLQVGRIDVALGTDTGRVKPFTAIGGTPAIAAQNGQPAIPASVGDYNRVLGNTPTLLAQSGATFGEVPPRWFTEPQSSAVALYTAYRVAFQGCLTLTGTPAQYASVPSNTTAETECAGFARKFWSRTATTDEVTACSKVAMVDAAKETDPRRRWAYTCAAVLSSAGFLTY